MASSIIKIGVVLLNIFVGVSAITESITPVRSVDKIQVGKGVRGEVTEALQKAFFDVVECRVPDELGWLTYVRDTTAAAPVAKRTSKAG